PLSQLSAVRVQELVSELETRGRRMFDDAGMGHAKVLVKISAAMRYVGQGYEVEVPLEDHRESKALDERLSQAFEAAYRQLYGRTESDTPVEVVSWRVVV